MFPDNIEFDLSLLSKFDYYNGVIFKGYNKALNMPIIRGGRYDQLSSLFNKLKKTKVLGS